VDRKKKYTVEDLQSILADVRATYGLTDQEISEKGNRNKGYIVQTLSRKSVSPLLIEDIKRVFSDAGKVSTPSDNDALLAVVVDRLSVLLSDRNRRSAQLERELMQKDAEALKEIRNG